jgi:hypothetical protein
MAIKYDKILGEVREADASGTNTGDQDLSGYVLKSGSLTQLTTRSHTDLTSIGTNTHAQIDTFIGTTVPATYAPLASPVFTTQITTPSIISSGALGITPASGSNLNINLATTGDLAVNTNQLYVDTSAGKVGIGTTGPTEKLHVAGGNLSGIRNEMSMWYANNSAGGEAGYYNNAYYSGGPKRFYADYANYMQMINGTYVFNTAVSDSAGSAITWSPKVTITNAGNVGIGTTAPGGLLEIEKNQNASTYLKVTNTDATDGSSRARIALTGGTVVQEMQSVAGDGGYFGTTSNHPFNIYTNGNTRLTVLAAGKVGIGTTAPTAKTHIDQSSTTGAIPVLTLDQADLSEEFIEFVGTVGAGNSIDTAAIGTYYGKVRVTVAGVGYKYIPLYSS